MHEVFTDLLQQPEEKPGESQMQELLLYSLLSPRCEDKDFIQELLQERSTGTDEDHKGLV